MSQPIVFGPAFSTFVRSVRLALAEKGVEHELRELDFLAGAHKQSEHLSRHPFGKVPAFEHDGLPLYEAVAIVGYVDEAFDGPKLTPDTPAERARMRQVMSIVDSYGYEPCVLGLFLQRVFHPSQGITTDEALVAKSVPPASRFVEVLEGLIGDREYLVGRQVTLADLHVLPVLNYLAAAPEGMKILESAPKLMQWLERMRGRPSVQQIMPEG